MLNPSYVLERFLIDPTNIHRALQNVREMLDTSGDTSAQLRMAEKIVMNLTGQSLTFVNEIQARHFTQSVVQQVVEQKENFMPEQAITIAHQKVLDMQQDPAFAYLYAAPLTSPEKYEQTSVIAGTEVVVKANGSIKKGGKQIIVKALYAEHVVGKKMSNADFIKLVISDVGLSPQGASTYAYNARKAHEQEVSK